MQYHQGAFPHSFRRGIATRRARKRDSVERLAVAFTSSKTPGEEVTACSSERYICIYHLPGECLVITDMYADFPLSFLISCKN